MNETSSTRLNKYLASAGICSRRKADELILAGLVKVNNKTITDLGYKVEVNDTVHYKNELVKPVTQLQYLLFNKPKDCITTLNDEKGRKTVFDFIKKYTNNRLVPVGRLDRNTTGLLLFTNDGELHHQLSHPTFEIQKIYKVKLDKNVTENDFK
ncbi:MAG: rRNA pseudouridine synthase, partial [Bacteroidetes bacterium]|nr:rRNA pseudouridine synthase [Bacteroidota bacterium]